MPGCFARVCREFTITQWRSDRGREARCPVERCSERREGRLVAAAVLGGTQSLHCNGRDEALALPTEESARIALRTQQILAAESGVANTVDPVAGAYAIERLMDYAAHEHGFDPVALRRLNFIAPAEFPYKTANGTVYDTCECARVMDRALEFIRGAGGKPFFACVWFHAPHTPVAAGRGVAWWTEAWQLFVASPVVWVIVALVVTLVGGFAGGLWWLDALIRRRHGGFRIY